MKNINLWLGDCLELMDNILDNSIDMVFADLPYGTTKCKWDVIIPFELLWKQYERIGKEKCVYIFSSNQPFTSLLVLSNLNLYQYENVWEKTRNSHPFFSKKRPLPQHETLQIFSKSKTHTYNPQMIFSDKEYKINKNTKGRLDGDKEGKKWVGEFSYSKQRFPHSVFKISNPSLEAGLHPTQKPIGLMDYILKTWSNEGDLILDNVMGSGSSGLSAKNLGRNFIGIEKEKKYYDIAVNRINS